LRVPTRFARVGANAESGLITTIIGSSDAADARAE
jgi:hypothetical protein